jgi:hypothetical protein
MIVDKNVNPERDLYYLGGILIDLLSNRRVESIDYLDLFQLFKQRMDITVNLFSFTLDWLFILGLVRKGENGKIIKCF